MTFSRAIGPIPAVAPRILSSSRSLRSSVYLNQEDAWILSRGLLLLLGIYWKGIEASPAHNIEDVLDYLSSAPISGIMIFGGADVTGMFIGQSIRSPKSLSTPLSLFPSSWRLDPAFATLQGGVPEEISLAFFAKKYLNVEPADNSVKELTVWADVFLSMKRAEMKGKHVVGRDPQRYSLPQPAETKKRHRLAARPQSFWFGSQKNTQSEVDPALRGWADPLPAAGDLGENRAKSSWRHSVQSLISNGSTATLNDSRSQSGHSRFSDRFSLKSDESFSSIFTRFSGSTSSTLLTVPSSSRRSSRVLQKEKRFSSVRLMGGIPWETDEVSEPGTPLPPATPTVASTSSQLLEATIPRVSSDSTAHMMEQGVLPPTPKLRGLKYAASLTSLLRRWEPPEETPPASAVSESGALGSGRRARFKRFVKDIFSI